MSDANSKRERAKHFSEQVTLKINNKFGSDIHWESDRPPSLKFVIKRSKTLEMRLEYNDSKDVFELYDRDQKTQTGLTLGAFSPENITNPSDTTVQELVNSIIKYIDA